jgi:hypothetical protein
MEISTKALSLLPDISALRRISQSLALLDAILSPDWEYRYHSFNCNWAPKQAIASMRNGEGDSYVVWFCAEGAVIKGFAHESPMSPYRVNPPELWPGILDHFPPQLSSFLTEPAFIREETTVCVWRTFTDANWNLGSIELPDGQDPDGSAFLFRLLDTNPRIYQQWAESYYERSVDLLAVTRIYEHQPLTDHLVAKLNPNISIQTLAADLDEIGYGV